MNGSDQFEFSLQCSVEHGYDGGHFVHLRLAPVTHGLGQILPTFAHSFGRHGELVLTGSKATLCRRGDPTISFPFDDDLADVARETGEVLLTVGLDATTPHCPMEQMFDWRFLSVHADRFVSHLLPVE